MEHVKGMRFGSISLAEDDALLQAKLNESSEKVVVAAPRRRRRYLYLHDYNIITTINMYM